MNTDELQSFHAKLATEDRNQTQGLSSLINIQEDERQKAILL